MNYNPSVFEKTTREVIAGMGLILRPKADAVEMRYAGMIFDVASLLVDVPTGREFVEEYATTVGPVIYTPQDFAFGVRGMRWLTHEAQHGVQFYAKHAAFAAEYLNPTDSGFRVIYETDAEVARWEVEFYLCGELPPREELSRLVQHGYAGGSFATQLGDGAARSRLAALQHGTFSTPAGRAMIAACQRNGIREQLFANRAEMEEATAEDRRGLGLDG